MKNIIISIFVVFSTLTSCAQVGKTPNDKGTSITQSIVSYRLFPTQNMWTFIKLNTRNGQIWQVQYDTKGNSRFTTNLNQEVLVSQEKEVNDRFTLHSTQNIYNFILLDQIDGRTWQVQWSLEPNNRFITPIE